MNASACPGCGVVLPASSAPAAPEGFHASPACWEAFGELCARTVSLRDPRFPHQHAVDAYEASHVGPRSRPVMAVMALAGLYLACERGLSGRAVQRAHMAIGARRREWPVFAAPATTGDVTVVDALAGAPGAALEDALARWMKSVWAAWGPEQARVRAMIAAWLPRPPGD
jgi:hypothetical protein